MRGLYVYGFAYFCVHSLAVAMAAASSSFQLLATSGARGSSGLGAPRRAWIESRIVRICSAGDQLSVCLCKPHTFGRRKRRGSPSPASGKKKPTLQHVQADATQLVNVRVEDLGEESNLGRSHGVVVWEEELELENAAFCIRVRNPGASVLRHRF
jgi:hypothetical protein